jgi:hypothetical protein
LFDNGLVRRLAASLAGAAVLVTGAAVSVPQAAAAGSFRSTTALKAAISENGRQLVLTAAVSGSFGTTSGAVVFTDNHRHLLATATLPECSSTCRVVERVPVTKLARRVSAVFASYSGNTSLKPSAAAVAVLYLRCRSAKCSSDIASTDTAFGLTISKGQTALATLGAQRLPCSIGAGQVVNLATTGGSTNLGIVLNEDGDAGTTYVQTDGDTYDSSAGHSAYRCLVTTSAFTGFSPGGSDEFSESSADFSHYGTTPRISSGHYKGQYVGLIPDCYQLATHAHTEAGTCENLPKLAGPLPDEVLIALTGGNRVSHFAG